MALLLSVLPKTSAKVRRSVNVNFYPPSSAAQRSDFWSGTGNSGGLMMARSLLWASNKTSGTVRVYYLHATSSGSWTQDVITNIQSANTTYGLGVTFTILSDLNGAALSSLTLANYDVCLISSDGSPGQWGGQLQTFALEGGGLVLSTFANASQTVGGLTYATYTPIQNPPGNQSLISSMNVNSIIAHPVTVGLSSLTFSNNGGYAGSGTQLSAGAISVVNYLQGTTLLAVKEVPL
jgi:hypothetical protein